MGRVKLTKIETKRKNIVNDLTVPLKHKFHGIFCKKTNFLNVLFLVLVMIFLAYVPY